MDHAGQTLGALVLLDEAELQPGECVIDIATGPGTVARLAATHLGAEGRILATDIAQPMLDIAKRKVQPPTSAPIEYLQSPAAPLAAATGELMQSYVSKVFSSSQTEQRHCERCVGS
jgi:ubiquinone/menaquinone biosynthesis C-methylase UbiE